MIIGLLNQIAPIVNLISSALSALGPSGTIALGVFTSLITILPGLISLLAALHVGTGNIALAALTFAALAAVTGVGVGLGLTSLSGSAGATENTVSALETDLNELDENSGSTSNSTTDNSTVINNNYYDNSTYNNTLNNDVDVDKLIEEIGDKKRVMIGG